jgi:hypothetical protein
VKHRHEKVGTMPSIAGTWNIRVTWSGGPLAGTEINGGHFTFNANGTWTDRSNHRGRWLQVGDQVVWTVTESPGLSMRPTSSAVTSCRTRPR